jgi:hypothetical protein
MAGWVNTILPIKTMDMKTINSLTNVDKAKLLHELFPDEIPAFITFTKNMCAAIKEDEQAQRDKWNFGLFGFDFWLTLIDEAERKINQYGAKLEKSSRLFSDQLFDGYIALYLHHCLTIYTTNRQHPNRKFVMAIDLLFNP